ncbi:MAG TPA: serine/threonine-protein kinase [Kofleriaceae bacterium]
MDRIGNYRIDCERSRDATGVVYEARHLVLPRRAILKVMEEKDAHVAAVQLLREACILEALEHPGVVRVYESGLLPDRRPWFAHERVDGATVADLFVGGPLDPALAAALLRDIAEVLEHAHRRGVIHCGLRPDRIAVTGRTRGFPLCIINWSDARTHDTSAPPPVAPASSPDYAAPELMRGDAIDDRVDVFALGVIGYQALTGELPFERAWIATATDGSTQHVPTEVLCPDAPPELTGLVDQLLAWDRWDRPSSAEAFSLLASLAADLSPAPQREASVVRIRKPKWTPALPVGDGLPDIVADDLTDEKSE